MSVRINFNDHVIRNVGFVLVLLLGSVEKLSPCCDYISFLALFFNFRLWGMVLPSQLQDISNMRKSFYHPQGKVPRSTTLCSKHTVCSEGPVGLIWS